MAEQRQAEVSYSRESLVAALRVRGVSYLAPSDAVAREVPESHEQLLHALLLQQDSRLRLAIVPLLLRHTEISESVPALAARLDSTLSLELQTLYMAAVYLQRHWRSRLSIYLDEVTLLPNLFSHQMGLPQPGEQFGKTGLNELSDAWRARSLHPFDRLQALTNTINLFFGQLKLEKATHCIRQRRDRQSIERFLQSLGRRFTKPGRLYLVGGTAMVYEGLRQQTRYIDISFEVDDRDHGTFVEAVRDLKERLSLNIEEASPAEFIPLPAGYRERSPFLGRYGQLEVFHFDLYSTALSKIERGTESDFDDVLSLLWSGRIEFEVLTGCFEEIVLRYAIESIKQDPVEYRRKFEILTDMWLTLSFPE